MITELYKYRAVNNFTLKLLVDQELHFSLPIEFNDPYDSYVEWKMEGSENEWKEWIFTNWPPQHAQIIFERMKAINFKESKLADILGDWNEHMQKQLYIFSMSKKNDKTVMWSHYADNHKGICIGFKLISHNTEEGLLLDSYGLNTKFFDRVDGGYFIKSYEVTYSLDTPEVFNPIKSKSIAEWLIRKHKNWEYEEERRIVIPVDWVTASNLKFMTASLGSITFGLKTEPYYKEIIKGIVDKHYDQSGIEVGLFQAERIPGSYLLKIVKL